jgi:hypothetical protein
MRALKAARLPLRNGQYPGRVCVAAPSLILEPAEPGDKHPTALTGAAPAGYVSG